MPQDALAAAFPRPARSRMKRADETLGVFSNGAEWKVYSPFDSAAAYPSRQEAIVAAEERAFAAARAGRRVELFVEHEDGSLAQAPLDIGDLDLH